PGGPGIGLIDEPRVGGCHFGDPVAVDGRPAADAVLHVQPAGQLVEEVGGVDVGGHGRPEGQPRLKGQVIGGAVLANDVIAVAVPGGTDGVLGGGGADVVGVEF